MSNRNAIEDKNEILNKPQTKSDFKFRKNPEIFTLLQFDKEISNQNNLNNPKEIKISNLIHKIKFGSFKTGNIFASFSFGVFLFAMQSYFLRQNLGLTDRSFISD